MDVGFLIQGIIIGFSIAAPVGPIGVLCIRRTLVGGALLGFVSGLGAATADAVYGSIAGMGLTFISNTLMSHRTLFRLVGGVFLCWLGVSTFLSKPHEGNIAATENRLAGAFASTFFLTLANPMTILSFTAIFAGLGVGNTSTSYASAGFLVLGVFLGSAMWWLALSGTVGLARSRFSHRALQRVNRIAGIIIAGFGVLAILSLTA